MACAGVASCLASGKPGLFPVQSANQKTIGIRRTLGIVWRTMSRGVKRIRKSLTNASDRAVVVVRTEHWS